MPTFRGNDIVSNLQTEQISNDQKYQKQQI